MSIEINKKNQCEYDKVPEQGRWPGFHRCSFHGTIQENGKWWCKKHAPSVLKAEENKIHIKYNLESDLWHAKDDLEQHKNLLIQHAMRIFKNEELVVGILQLKKKIKSIEEKIKELK